MRTTSRRPVLRTLVVGLAAAALAVGCGSSKSSGTAGSATTASTGGKTLRVGYSAWPGWFPLAVAEKEGLFKKAGVNVKLTYFADYTSSLDALVAKQLDVNAQTLNDTMFAVASGSPQTIIVTGDNSTGNDQVICDKSITRASSHTPRPPALWPPPRTDTVRPCSRAKLMHVMTSAASAHRAIAAGRRSIMAL